MQSCLFLYRMFRLHIQLLSHLVAIIGKEVVIEGLLVTSNRTSDASGMGCEDGTNLWQFIVDIKGTKSAHPFIGMIDNLCIVIEGFAFDSIHIKALHDQCCSIREHRCFVIVTISMERIYCIVFPQPAIYLIFLFKERFEINQYGNRFSWNSPTTNPYR